MGRAPLTVERVYKAPIEKVWRALTDRDQMKQWYFEIQEFRPEVGFKFSFSGGDDTVQYLHECEVLEVDPPVRLSYTWTYPEHQRFSSVRFELFKEEEGLTRLKLTHEGLDTFPQDEPNFAIESFTAGWNEILGNSLKNFLEV